MKNSLPALVAALASMCASQLSLAEVSLAEQRLSNELKATLTEGIAVALGEPDQTFLGIFSEARIKKPKGGIILLHDANTHADWPEVISPLRRQLTLYGWHTLSIQLPAIPQYDTAMRNPAQWESLEQNIQRRIQAAIQYCRSKRIFNLVLLGHQFGALSAGRYVAQQRGDQAISALVTLNLYSSVNPDWIEPETLRKMIANIKIAFLDLVPSQSPDYVLQLAADRKAAMNKLGYDKYRQIHIIGADYSFRGAERSLISRVQTWLARLAPSMEVQIAPATTPPTNAAKPR